MSAFVFRVISIGEREFAAIEVIGQDLFFFAVCVEVIIINSDRFIIRCLRRLFRPRLPAMRSMLPSLLRSTGRIKFHHPFLSVRTFLVKAPW